MSTKCSIEYSEELGLHVYTDCLDADGRVYLELWGEEVRFEASPKCYERLMRAMIDCRNAT